MKVAANQMRVKLVAWLLRGRGQPSHWNNGGAFSAQAVVSRRRCLQGRAGGRTSETMIADGAWGASTVMVVLVDRHRRPTQLQPCTAQEVTARQSAAGHPGCAPRAFTRPGADVRRGGWRRAHSTLSTHSTA